MSAKNKSSFAEAGEAKQTTLLSECFAMMNQNKKYWLAPLIIILLVFGLLITLGSSVAAPFIYTLF